MIPASAMVSDALFVADGTVVDMGKDMTRKASWLIPLSFLTVTVATEVDAGECLTMKVSLYMNPNLPNHSCYDLLHPGSSRSVIWLMFFM